MVNRNKNLNGMYIPTAESTTDFTNDILITKPISNKLNQISISDLWTLPIFKLDFPIDIYSKFQYLAEPQPKLTNKHLINLQFIKLVDPDSTQPSSKASQRGY